MSKTIYAVVINTNASAGIFAFNTLPIRAGICKHVLVASASSDTTFDFKIIDSDSDIVYDTERREKTATFVLDDEVNIPMAGGIYTLRLYNASTDETFTGKIMVADL